MYFGGISSYSLTPLEGPRPPLSHVESAVWIVVVVVALVGDRPDLLRRASAALPAPLRRRDFALRQGQSSVVQFACLKMPLCKSS